MGRFFSVGKRNSELVMIEILATKYKYIFWFKNIFGEKGRF